MIFWLLATVLAAEPEWGGWSDRWPPPGGVVVAETAPDRASPGLLESAYRWYRSLPDRGVAGCPYYPTCSGYFILNVREHGPILAGLFTWDRFMREYPFMEHADHYPLVTPHGTPRLYDPIPVRRTRDERRRERILARGHRSRR